MFDIYFLKESMIDLLISLWNFLKEDVGLGILIQSILIIVGWLIAFIIMNRQVKKSYKFNLNAQINLFKQQSKYEAYKSITDSATKFGNSLTDLFGFLSSMKTKLVTLNEYEKHEFQPFKWDTVPNELLDVNEKSSESFLNLVFTYENHEIFLMEFKKILDEIKKMYFEEVNEKLNNLYYIWLTSCSMLTSIPLQEHRKDSEDKINFIIDKIFTVQIYLYDLRIELQNEIFGDIFNKKLLRRKPSSSGIKPLNIN